MSQSEAARLLEEWRYRQPACPGCGQTTHTNDCIYLRLVALLEAAEARERALREALAHHECPLGPKVVWCSEHGVYHPKSIDDTLAARATPETRLHDGDTIVNEMLRRDASAEAGEAIKPNKLPPGYGGDWDLR